MCKSGAPVHICMHVDEVFGVSPIKYAEPANILLFGKYQRRRP